MTLKSAGKEEKRQRLAPLDMKLLSILKAAETRKEYFGSLMKTQLTISPGRESQEAEIIIADEIEISESKL